MLRLLVLLLLLANGAYYAWADGLLLSWGFGPLPEREPHRLAQQVKPEAVRVLPPEEARRLQAEARPAECLQAGPFETAAIDPLRQALVSWPESAWSLEPVNEPGRWIVYMGKYPNAENVERKKGELRQIGVTYEALSNPDLEPGLSLGGFPTQEAAQQQLEKLNTRGVRTAKVVQERPEVRGQRLVLPALDDSLRGRLDDLKPALGGKPLRPCR
ncbi:SPOR domain-containing protein [Ramlibacter humi]|uniref:SPOR domain-containing protein n=1 Tax=Ramlibacter humi TaxID=2530451 RepID=A0A4Z0BUL2_9BURK|nr:SPOR domain-containing protein [Ramlibacter humi]TFZ01958.1 SPOR domain-containing protein [Ramlibacter humi]